MKLWLGLLFVSVFVLVAACAPTIPDDTPLSGDTAVDLNDACSPLDGRAKDNCYAEALKCSKVSDVPMRDSCVAELAKKKGDLAVCNLIKSGMTKGYCQEQISELKNDQSLCLEIKDQYWQDNCYFSYATKNKKGEECSLVKNGQQKAECFKDVAVATQNALLCDFMSGNDREGCL